MPTAAVKSGYKHTEIGAIPDSWAVARISEKTTKVGSGITPTGGERSYKTFGRPFVRSQNVGLGVLNLDDVAFIDESTHQSFSETEIRLGDVLLNITGASIGRCAVADSRLEGGNVNQHVCLIRVNESEVVPRYLSYLLLSSLGQRQIDSFQAGGNRQGLNFSQVRSIRLPLPQTTEQCRITEALSDTDAYIDYLQKLIAKKRDLKQATMQQLLSGKKRLAGFKDGWAQKLLGGLFTFGGGYSASRAQLSSEGHRYLHYGDIHTSNKVLVDVDSDHGDLPRLRVPLSKVAPASLLCDGDVVFVDASEDAAGTSKHVVVKNEANLPFISGLHTIVAKRKTDELRREYLCHCFQTHEIRRQFLFYAVGTKVSGVSKGNIGKIELPAPSPAEQTAIAEVLSDMDSEIEALEDKLSKVRQIKQGMMQELLTGRIRLV